MIMLQTAALRVGSTDIDSECDGRTGMEDLERPAGVTVALPERPRRIERDAIDRNAEKPHSQGNLGIGSFRIERYFKLQVPRPQRNRVMRALEITDRMIRNAIFDVDPLHFFCWILARSGFRLTRTIEMQRLSAAAALAVAVLWITAFRWIFISGSHWPVVQISDLTGLETMARRFRSRHVRNRGESGSFSNPPYRVRFGPSRR